MTNFLEEMREWQKRKERFITSSTVNCPKKQIQFTIPVSHEQEVRDYIKSLREKVNQENIKKFTKEFELNNPPPRNE